MRVSDWQIVWDPEGGSPLVLLDLSDLMEDEIARTLEQLAGVLKYDFARSGLPVSYRNEKQSLTWTRRREHDSVDAAWDACSQMVQLLPWGAKATLRVTPRDSAARYYCAALLSSSHVPDAGIDAPESVHTVAMRVSPLSAVDLGGGVVLFGGYYAPVGHYVFPPLPPGVTVPPGTVVVISGTPGLPTGSYVTGEAEGGGGVPSEGGSVEVTELKAPKYTTVPHITGVASVGLTLTRTHGIWTGNPTPTLTGEWLLNGGNTAHTADVYTVPPEAADGDAIWYRETGTNSAGSATADSNILLVAPLEFKNIGGATITGGSDPGDALTATPGTWQAADSVAGEWYYNGAATGNATVHYAIPSFAVSGDSVFYRETATKAGSANLMHDSNTLYVGYDASPLHLAAAPMWIADSGQNSPKYWTGIRELVMAIEWVALPAGAEIDLAFIFPDRDHGGFTIPWDGYNDTSYSASGSGASTIKTSTQVLSNAEWEDGQIGDVPGVISDQLNGVLLAIGLDYDTPFYAGGVSGAFPSGDVFAQDPLGWTLTVKVDGATVATWTVHPQLSAVGDQILHLDNISPAFVTETSARKIRIEFDGSSYVLKTPSNFVVS